MISTIKFYTAVLVCLLGFNAANLSAQDWTKSVKGEFNQLDVFGRADVKLVPSGANEISVKASGVEEKDIKIQFSGGACKIKINNLMKAEANFDIEIEVAYTSLDKLTLAAGAGVYSNESFEVKNTQIKVLSGAQFEAELFGGSVNFDVAQGSQVKVLGEVDNLNVEATTGAIFDGLQLKVNDANAKANTGGEVLIGNVENLNAKAQTGGSVNYRTVTGKFQTNTKLGGSVNPVLEVKTAE
ncbi:GIN domain-containing protein [Luteibaculum oceani]|nr:DUF2807 domain-containing protein [Luteibaculum oceani]